MPERSSETGRRIPANQKGNPWKLEDNRWARTANPVEKWNIKRIFRRNLKQQTRKPKPVIKMQLALKKHSWEIIEVGEILALVQIAA